MVLGVEQARGQGADVRRSRPSVLVGLRGPGDGGLVEAAADAGVEPVDRFVVGHGALGLGEGAGDGHPVGVRARVQPTQRGGPGDQAVVGGHRVGAEQVVGDPGRRAEVLHHHERRVGRHPEQTGRHADRPGGGQTHALACPGEPAAAGVGLHHDRARAVSGPVDARAVAAPERTEVAQLAPQGGRRGRDDVLAHRAAARTTITSGRSATICRHESPESDEAHTAPLRVPT